MVDLETGSEMSASAQQWTVPVTWFLKEIDWRQFQGTQSLKAYVEVGGSMLSLDDAEFETSYERIGQLPNVLHLSAWVTPISIIRWVIPDRRHQPPREQLQSVAVVEGAKDGRRLEWRFSATTATMPLAEESAYIAIELGRDPDQSLIPCNYALVAVEVSPGTYERVGIGTWDQVNLEDPSNPAWFIKCRMRPYSVVKVWKEFQLK